MRKTCGVRVTLAAWLIVCLLGKTTTAAVYGTIEGVLRMPDGKSPLVDAKISLNDGDRITYSKHADGSFIFYNVPPGIHLLDVHSHDFQYGQIKVQLLEESMDEPKCIEYAYPGAPKKVTAYPLQLKPHAAYQYFEVKKGFNLFSILKNPMVLMMLFSGGMMFMMPKLMEGMDPEERAQMQQQMQNQQDPSKMLSSLWNDISAGGQGEVAQPSAKSKKK
mmetsp:Transcript_3324/g.5058  ORF Transcript_3324/g.5058 Transcript_3324/m.5058 type:complete len:219 (+) Transcript_3324:86-742(+)